jgi:hypothetical protein
MQVRVITDRYVHFDTNGNITKIARNPDGQEESIKVEFDKVKGMLEGKESLVDYKVEYDFLDKQHVLKHINTWKQDQLKDAFMLEISNDADADITIVQDKKQRVWRLVLGDNLLKSVTDQGLTVDPTAQYYSVTKKHDPNILYRLLKFNKQDNEYTVPFNHDFEIDNLSLSIYTVRKFSTYAYEVIDG